MIKIKYKLIALLGLICLNSCNNEVSNRLPIEFSIVQMRHDSVDSNLNLRYKIFDYYCTEECSEYFQNGFELLFKLDIDKYFSYPVFIHVNPFYHITSPDAVYVSIENGEVNNIFGNKYSGLLDIGNSKYITLASDSVYYFVCRIGMNPALLDNGFFCVKYPFHAKVDLSYMDDWGELGYLDSWMHAGIFFPVKEGVIYREPLSRVPEELRGKLFW